MQQEDLSPDITFDPVNCRWTVPVMSPSQARVKYSLITTVLQWCKQIFTVLQKALYQKHFFIKIVHPTVGAQSITRFLKKIVFLPQHISGHRHDRELWFFFV
jgi:hypothetical protein